MRQASRRGRTNLLTTLAPRAASAFSCSATTMTPSAAPIARPDSASRDDRREGGRYLPREGDPDDPTEILQAAELPEPEAKLERHDHANEGARHDHDPQRLHADRSALTHDLAKLEGTLPQRPKAIDRERVKLLRFTQRAHEEMKRGRSRQSQTGSAWGREWNGARAHDNQVAPHTARSGNTAKASGWQTAPWPWPATAAFDS